MPASLSEDQLRRLRLRAQRLDRRPSAGIARIATDVCAVQAQDPAAAALAVRARGAGLVAADGERARVEARSIVRTWAMRGTLHLLATDDLGWLLPLLGPIFVRASRRRYAELGLDEDVYAAGVRAIRDLFANRGPLTRAELRERLAAQGIRVEGQAAPHLLRRAALEGVVCLGPDRGGEPTYVLLEEWIADRGSALPREAALPELARRYLAAFGPAGPEDLAAWSGLSVGEARRAWELIADDLIEIEVVGRPTWMLKSHTAWLDEPSPASPTVRLLPSFDPYLLGYRGRDLVVAPEHARRIHPGGGILRPTLLADGRAVGTWKSKRRRDRLDITVEPFEALAPEVLPGLEAEVADVGRFLGLEATLRVMGRR